MAAPATQPRATPGVALPPPREREAHERFPCFGGECAVLVRGRGPAGNAQEAVTRVRRRMLAWHAQLSRFDPASELSQLNRDPRRTVPVSPVMASFLTAAVSAARMSGGLVDPTLLGEVEAAGYRAHFSGDPIPLRRALALAPPRRPAAPSPLGGWRLVAVDRAAGTVTRPPGVLLDSGGIAKGLFADVVAEPLSGHASFAVNAAGDLSFGGAAGLPRPVQVTDPFDGSVLHVFERLRGAAATSGISRRSWLDGDGVPAHHLLDPARGTPAFTGVVQVTALAPSAVVAETLAKAALLSGPVRAPSWLVHGGLVVRDDGSHVVVEPGGVMATGGAR